MAIDLSSKKATRITNSIAGLALIIGIGSDYKANTTQFPPASVQVQNDWKEYLAARGSHAKLELFELDMKKKTSHQEFNQYKIKYESAENTKQNWNNGAAIGYTVTAAFALLSLYGSTERITKQHQQRMINERPMRKDIPERAFK